MIPHKILGRAGSQPKMDTGSSIASNATDYTTVSKLSSTASALVTDRSTSSSSDTSTSSSSSNKKNNTKSGKVVAPISRDTYIRHLPYSVVSKLRSMLDPDALWKRLCCQITDPSSGRPRYTVYDIQNFELSLQRRSDGSPTRDMLHEWGTQNTTVQDLMDKLVAAHLYHCANYLAVDVLAEPPVYEATEVTPMSSDMKTAGDRAAGLSSESMDERGFSLHVENRPSEGHVVMDAPPLHNTDSKPGGQSTITVIKAGSDIVEYPYSLLSRLTAGFDRRSVADGGHRIGCGGFASVYWAPGERDSGTGGQREDGDLAIKVLSASGPDVRRQFKTEVELLSNYRHANLLPLLGYSVDGDQLCLVYAYMSGGSLQDRLRPQCDKPLDWAMRMNVAVDTACGLEYLHCHEQKLIHRDIKSANILLDASGRAKIGDFGIAKLTPSGGAVGASTTTSFQTETIIGTSAYMAPEAYRGTVTGKMDVFAFGVVLLELITGQAPQDDSREETDLISYVEEECDNLVKIIDPRCGDEVSEECATRVLELARACYATAKKDRPDIGKVVEELVAIKKSVS